MKNYAMTPMNNLIRALDTVPIYHTQGMKVIGHEILTVLEQSRDDVVMGLLTNLIQRFKLMQSA